MENKFHCITALGPEPCEVLCITGLIYSLQQLSENYSFYTYFVNKDAKA